MPRAEFTRAVKLAAWERAEGCCEACIRKLFPGDRIEYDHIIRCEIEPDNSLGNCQVLCGTCHALKTYGKDAPAAAKSRSVRAKHVGAAKARRPVPGSRNHRLKKKANGDVVDRETGEVVWPKRPAT